MKSNRTKTKSIFLDIHKGSTYGHQRQETLLKFEKRNNIYKQVRTLPAQLLGGSVQSRLGLGGRLESSSQGRAWKGGVG